MTPYLILIGGLVLDVALTLIFARAIGYGSDEPVLDDPVLRDWEGEEPPWRRADRSRCLLRPPLSCPVCSTFNPPLACLWACAP